MADTQVTFDIIARDRASRTLKSVGRQAETTGDKFRRSLGGVARVAAVAARGVAVAGGAMAVGLGAAVTKASTFDKTMRTVAVATKAPQDALKELSDLALKMGADTVFSAQDAGDAMLELAKGGMSAATIQGGTLQETLTLAAAGGTDLASAAGFMTRGLKTFRLTARQAGRVTTALAGGATQSTASIEELGQALQQVGPGAKNAGLSIEETVAALAAFADNGIRGSDAGTSLKTMLTRLIPSTIRATNAMDMYNLKFVDQEGNFNSLTTIAQKLQDQLGGLTQAERTHTLSIIFGSDATRAATVLMNEGATGLRTYLAATKDAKNAQDLANVAMEGAAGAWENFKGSVETVAIQIGQKFLPAANKALRWAAEKLPAAFATAEQWVDSVKDSFKRNGDYLRAEWIPAMQKAYRDALPNLEHAATDLKDALDDLRAMFGLSGDAGKDFRGQMGLLPAVLKTVAFQARIVAANIRVITGAFRLATLNSRWLARGVAYLLEKLKDLAGWLLSNSLPNPFSHWRTPGLPDIPGVPGIATGGTVSRSGMAWVGERGPELVKLPSGATVYDAKQSAAYASGGAGLSVTQHIQSTDPQRAADESARSIRRVAWSAGWGVA